MDRNEPVEPKKLEAILRVVEIMLPFGCGVTILVDDGVHSHLETNTPHRYVQKALKRFVEKMEADFSLPSANKNKDLEKE